MLHSIRRWFLRGCAGLCVFGLCMITSEYNPLPHLTYQTNSALYLASLPVLKPVLTPRKPSDNIFCLAQNLYFEAHNEPLDGLEAVAATVFNRMTLHIYPSTICAVVYQPFQYSWTMDVSNWKLRPPTEYLDLARTFLRDRYVLQSMYPVTHFHRSDIAPSWSKTLIFVGQYGQHKFYGPGGLE